MSATLQSTAPWTSEPHSCPAPATDSQSEPELFCEDVERFGDLLNKTGFDYDYTASESPSDLAERADAVFGGHLTGEVSTVELVTTEDPHPSTFVGFEVEVDRVAKGTKGIAVGELAEVFVEYSPSALSLGEADTGMVAQVCLWSCSPATALGSVN